MKRSTQYIIGTAGLCSPLVGALHAVLFDGWKNSLVKVGVEKWTAELVVSLGVSAGGIALTCLVSGLIYWCLGMRIRSNVRSFYWTSVQDLRHFLEQFREEINREIGLYVRKGDQYDTDKWESLKSICDTILAGGNMFIMDPKIEKYLRRSPELAVLRELRDGVSRGMERVQEILGSGEKGINTIHRAEEMVADVNMRHMVQFQSRLSEL